MSTSSPDRRRRFLGLSLAAIGTAVSPASGATKASSASEAVALPTWLVIYGRGPAWIPDQPVTAQPLKEHGAYMLKLYRQRILRFAGGFADDSGGAACFVAADESAAHAILAVDPGVTSGVLVPDLRPWRLVDWARFG